MILETLLSMAKSNARDEFLKICPTRFPIAEISLIEKIEDIRKRNLNNCIEQMERFSVDGVIGLEMSQREIISHLVKAKMEIFEAIGAKNFSRSV